MKIQLRVLLPSLPEAIGRKELDVEFPGDSVSELLDYLVAQYGTVARQALYDEKGMLDPVVQVLLNGQEWIRHDRLETALKDGDSVILMAMIAGG